MPLPYPVDFAVKDQFEDDQGKLEGEDGWDEDNTAGDDPWDLQAGHGTHIAGMIYARELMEGNDSIISRREQFRRISQSGIGFWNLHRVGRPATEGPSGSGRPSRTRWMRSRPYDGRSCGPSISSKRWRTCTALSIISG